MSAQPTPAAQDIASGTHDPTTTRRCVATIRRLKGQRAAQVDPELITKAVEAIEETERELRNLAELLTGMGLDLPSARIGGALGNLGACKHDLGSALKAIDG